MTRLRLAIHSDLRERGEQAAVYRETLDLFTRAEELGFDGAWVRSYKFRRTGGTPGFSFPGGLPSPFPFLGALAARTSRIRLGTAVVPLPLENVVRVAEDAAVLDALSAGRLELGVSNGGQPAIAAINSKSIAQTLRSSSYMLMKGQVRLVMVICPSRNRISTSPPSSSRMRLYSPSRFCGSPARIRRR